MTTRRATAARIPLRRRLVAVAVLVALAAALAIAVFGCGSLACGAGGECRADSPSSAQEQMP